MDKKDRLINEYKKNLTLYDNFTKTVKNLLEKLLRENKILAQSVSSRTKDISSFDEKLQKNRHLQNKQLNQIYDLAGCRVIFYLEEAIDFFASVLHKEFDVIKYTPKISPNDYNARHLIVRFKGNRLALPEYSDYRDLVCEIQLTTVLYHAWSEMYHDIIYKPSERLLEFDRPAFDSLKNYFEEIMEKHLKEASKGFSFIFSEFEKIKKGKTIIDPNLIDATRKSKSNNELLHFLRLLNQYVGKYVDRLPREYKLIEVLESILENAEKNPIVDRKTVFGDLKGITYLDIADIILDILDNLRFYDIPNNLHLIYKLSKHKELRKKCEDILGRISGYNIRIISKYGYSIQKTVLDNISVQKPDYIKRNLDGILASLRPIANLDCEDSFMSSPETFTMRQGCLPVNDSLRKIRERHFSLTKNIFDIVDSDIDRGKVLNVIYSFSNSPRYGKMTKDINDLLIRDITDINKFLIEYYDSASNFIKNDIQSYVFRLERLTFHKKITNFPQLKKIFEEDTDYTKFKILYGYDIGFNSSFDHDKAKEYRNQKIIEFVKQIKEENIEEWIKLFKELLVNYTLADHGKYMYFAMFLEKIGQQKPKIAFKLLDIKEINPFIDFILTGLLKSSEQRKAKKMLIEYSKEKSKQLATIQSLYFKGDFDSILFNELYPKLIRSKNVNVLVTLLQTIIRYYKKHKNHEEKISEIINKLTVLKFHSWPSKVGYLAKDYLAEISDENIKAILNNLKYCDHISYDEEHILDPICEKKPKDIIAFFHERLKLTKAKKITEAIPFSFQTNHKTLAKNYNIILPEIIKWFSEDDIEKWHASLLIKNIFPSFGPNLGKTILDLVKTKRKENLMIVLHILEKYKGETFLHDIIKEIIKLYPLDKKLIRILYRILSNIGVVSGEYGILEAHERKKKETEDWLTDQEPKIQKFTKGYHTHLDQFIDIEKDRVSKEITFRKKEFEMGHDKKKK